MNQDEFSKDLPTFGETAAVFRQTPLQVVSNANIPLGAHFAAKHVQCDHEVWLVETKGVEPSTSAMPLRRSPN
jgi:hypothetical protein